MPRPVARRPDHPQLGRTDETGSDGNSPSCASPLPESAPGGTRSLELAEGDGSKKDEKSALPEGVKLIRTLDFGAVLVIEALWERLGIGPILRKLMAESGAASSMTALLGHDGKSSVRA